MPGNKINSTRQLTVPGGYGRSIDVKKGQYIAVRDIEGGQCGDFWAIEANDFDHFLSPPHTWIHLGRIQPRIGDELVTNRREPILIIVVSACPMDLNPIGGQAITDLEILVAETEEEIIRILN